MARTFGERIEEERQESRIEHPHIWAELIVMRSNFDYLLKRLNELDAALKDQEGQK